jgi:hypothetical protein
MRTSYSRLELYELVWTKPIVQLAEQFGLSDRGLAKICERHQIPVPGRGYWARLEAGQPLKKTPLWKIDNPNIETVFIGGTRQYVNPYVASVIEATKAAKAQVAQTVVANDEAAEPPEALLRRVAGRQHPALRLFSKELLEATADRSGAISVRWVSIHRDSASRVISFLSALAFGLEPYGIVFDGSGSRVRFGDGAASVDFEITSPKKKVTSTSPTGWTRWENVFVGRLAFRIFGHAEGIRKSWVDTEARKIETELTKVIESYRINIILQAEKDRKQREVDERRHHLAQRRELVQKRAKREEDRLAYLQWIADARREANDLRATIALVPQTQSPTGDYERMMEWARVRLEMLEAQTTVGRIQSDLEERQLYPDPDPLHDPEGEPPPKVNYWDD